MLEPSDRLRHAIREGNLTITKRLLSRFPELWLNKDPKNKGWSNLHYASYHGHYLICFYLVSFINKTYGSLLEMYSKTDLLTFDNLTVLHLSLLKHHSQTLHYLLQEFPGEYWVNYPGGPLLQTPLHYSCEHGFREGTTLLLEFGANWMIQDAKGDTCLHFCFQHGHIECLRSILRFILAQSKDKESGISQIKELEAVKNKRGWNAVNYATSIDMEKHYNDMKEALFSSNLSRNDHSVLLEMGSANSSLSHLIDTSSPESASLNHRILASPIVPMGKSQTLTATAKNRPAEENEQKKNRAHSQSLPTCPETETTPKTKELSTRQRSNTTYNHKPPSHTLNHQSSAASLAHTPKLQQFSLAETPSLKSVTISPSVRAPSNKDDLSSVSSSPSNSATNISLTNSSPTGSIKGMGVEILNFDTNESANNSIADKWPSFDASPKHIVSQTISFQKPRNAKLYTEEKSSPLSTSFAPIQTQDRQNSDYTRGSRMSSPSAIATKMNINTSRSSLNDSPIRNNRMSFSGAPSSENSPSLRKASLSNPSSNYNSSKARSSSISTFTSISDSNSENPKSSKVSSISFNRVR